MGCYKEKIKIAAINDRTDLIIFVKSNRIILLF